MIYFALIFPFVKKVHQTKKRPICGRVLINYALMQFLFMVQLYPDISGAENNGRQDQKHGARIDASSKNPATGSDAPATHGHSRKQE